jgi:hypothetical protein
MFQFFFHQIENLPISQSGTHGTSLLKTLLSLLARYLMVAPGPAALQMGVLIIVVLKTCGIVQGKEHSQPISAFS